MKRLTFVLLCFVLGSWDYALAQVKISDLPVGGAVVGTTQIPAVQGATTVGITPELPWTFSFPSASGISSVAIASSNPIFEWNRTTSAADNRRWRMFAGTNNWQMGPCADDGTTCTVSMQVVRNASVTTDIDIQATNVRVNGAPVSTALIKHARVAVASIPADSGTDVLVTWPSAFADVNYTTTCSAQETAPNGAQGTRADHLAAQTAADIHVTVYNADAAPSSAVTLHCMAIHD